MEKVVKNANFAMLARLTSVVNDTYTARLQIGPVFFEPITFFGEYLLDEFIHYKSLVRLLVELVPTLGDDYNEVLKRVRSNPSKDKLVVVVGSYEGVATFEQIRAIFKSSNISLVLESEIEAEKVNSLVFILDWSKLRLLPQNKLPECEPK